MQTKYTLIVQILMANSFHTAACTATAATSGMGTSPCGRIRCSGRLNHILHRMKLPYGNMTYTYALIIPTTIICIYRLTVAGASLNLSYTYNSHTQTNTTNTNTTNNNAAANTNTNTETNATTTTTTTTIHNNNNNHNDTNNNHK